MEESNRKQPGKFRMRSLRSRKPTWIPADGKSPSAPGRQALLHASQRAGQLVLLCGVFLACLCYAAPQSSASSPSPASPPLFAAGAWYKAEAVKALQSRSIPSDFVWAFNTLGFSTAQDAAGQARLDADGVMDRHGLLQPCEGAWCMNGQRMLSFEISDADTIAVLHAGAGVPTGKYLRVPPIPGEAPNGYADGPYRSLYFTGIYTCLDIARNIHVYVVLHANGAIAGHPKWKHYTVQTQHQKPLLVMEKQDGRKEFYCLSTSPARTYGFRLLQVLHPYMLRNGEGNPVETGKAVYDFDRH